MVARAIVYHLMLANQQETVLPSASAIDYTSSTIADLFAALQTGHAGLTQSAAAVALRQYGPNVIVTDGHSRALVLKFLSNFTHTMAIMLWVAGAIAFTGQLAAIGSAIWTINIINGCFSFFQEYKADKAAQALQSLLPQIATVMREGNPTRIEAALLVPGDLVTVAAGDQVPADLRILEESSVVIDESILTGESVPIRKQSAAKAPKNILYGGSTVTGGSAKGIVFATGSNAAFGKMAALTTAAKRAPSPLECEMARVSHRISILAVSMGALIFLAAILLTRVPVTEAFIFALGIIVAFVPEGMVPTVALALALGVEEMARQRALVKKLSAVETLGCTTVICTDKTGTLTQNCMTAKDYWTRCPELEADLLRICCLCNDAEITKREDQGGFHIIGDSTEAALLIFAHDHGIDYGAVRDNNRRLDVLPFDSDRKRMTTLNQVGNSCVAHVKGAPSEVLRRCGKLTMAEKERIEAKADEFASDGLRVLGFAQKTFETPPGHFSIGNIEQHLEFVGLVALFDPPRPEVHAAVVACHAAGIKVIMLTGDHARTAEAVARHVEIVQGHNCRVVEGREVESRTDEDLQKLVQEDVIFCRVSPRDKLRIVSAFQSNGHVVAVTGDGVNDAAALRQAHIGIAMGIRGTDVAREAADVILLDDNFATIVRAIGLGRRVYDNIRKFSKYVFTSNMAEAVPVAVFVLAAGMVPLPLTIMQVLSVDLGTDILPAIGLGIEPADSDIMQRKPRSLKDPLLNKSTLIESLWWYGLIESCAAMACFFFSNWVHGRPPLPLFAPGMPGYAEATTMTLTGIVCGQIGAVLCYRSEQSIVSKNPFGNKLVSAGIMVELLLLGALMYVPALQAVFGTAPITAIEATFAAVWIPVMIFLDEGRKAMRARVRIQ